MDTLTKAQRSALMSRVRSKDSRPEMFVRRLVFALGYRYRLHVSGMPGRPDLVFSGRRKVIFVHGCFWHRHARCKLARLPKSRLEFWIPKLDANRRRDRKNVRVLRRKGWAVLMIWECGLGNPRLPSTIERFLDAQR